MWTDSRVVEERQLLEHLQVVNGQVSVNPCHVGYMVRALQTAFTTFFTMSLSAQPCLAPLLGRLLGVPDLPTRLSLRPCAQKPNQTASKDMANKKNTAR
jgi:hypothetical protein